MSRVTTGWTGWAYIALSLYEQPRWNWRWHYTTCSGEAWVLLGRWFIPTMKRHHCLSIDRLGINTFHSGRYCFHIGVDVSWCCCQLLACWQVCYMKILRKPYSNLVFRTLLEVCFSVSDIRSTIIVYHLRSSGPQPLNALVPLFKHTTPMAYTRNAWP